MVRLVLEDVGSACEAMFVHGGNFGGSGPEAGQYRKQPTGFQ